MKEKDLEIIIDDFDNVEHVIDTTTNGIFKIHLLESGKYFLQSIDSPENMLFLSNDELQANYAPIELLKNEHGTGDIIGHIQKRVNVVTRYPVLWN